MTDKPETPITARAAVDYLAKEMHLDLVAKRTYRSKIDLTEYTVTVARWPQTPSTKASITVVRPWRICLCGSTRFKVAYIEWNARFTLGGKVVLSVAMWSHSNYIEPSPHEKTILDQVHLAKIDCADEVFVLDVGGYIGESTRREIEYAEKTGKPVYYLSKLYPDWTESQAIYARIGEPESRTKHDATDENTGENEIPCKPPINNCVNQAIEALEYLSKWGKCPSGGNDFPNTECCQQIANELRLSVKQGRIPDAKTGEGR